MSTSSPRDCGRIAPGFLTGRCAATAVARKIQTQTNMKTLLSRLVGRAVDLAQNQPLLALCLGAALLAVFVSVWRTSAPAGTKPSLAWTLYSQSTRLLFAAAAVLLLVQTLGVLRSYLRKSVAHLDALWRIRFF